VRTAVLGKTGLTITRVGFGAWALGGQWGTPSDSESIAAIQRAVERGINWIDTAPSYGKQSHSEEVVGRAIRKLQERPLVFTKCGFRWSEDGVLTSVLKGASIREEVEGSLRRLGVEAIDLYQIHWREPDADIEEAWGTLADLKREGKVRHIGVSNFDVAQIKRCERIAPVETLQPPYSMLIRTSFWTAPFVDNTPRESIEAEILPYCETRGIGVIVYSPMASGLLSGTFTAERAAALPPDDWRRAELDFQEPTLSRTLALASALETVAQGLGCSLGELAIAWTLCHPAVAGAIVGFRRAEQVGELAGAAEITLSGAVLGRIDEILASAEA